MVPLHDLPRQLPFQGANNFRDLGGYPCADGRRIKRGLIYRSDHLGNLTADDQELIRQLGIRTVIDLRQKRERAESLDRLDDSSIHQIWLPVNAQGADVHALKRRLEDGSMTEQQAREHLIEANREFVRDFSHVFREFMQLLLDAEHSPLVFHCTAGKDRAGFAAALFLASVGVTRDIVVHDYLATNTCTRNFLDSLLEQLSLIPDLKASPTAVTALLSVEKAYLEAAFSTIDSEYGSLTRYIEEALELTSGKRARLQAIFCE